MKNRVLSVLLTLCMVLALFPGTAFAAGNNRAAEDSIGTSGNEVYAVGSDVTLADLVSAVSTNGTVAVDKSYTLAEDTTPVQINKAFTLSLGEKNINASLNVVEGGDLTVTGTGSLTGSLTMAAGTYRGTLPTGTKTITGGAFTVDVSEFINADLYQCVLENGLYVVSAKTTEPEPGEYTITVSKEGNGTVAASAEKATAGTQVTITATPAEGYQLGTITVMNGTEAVTVTGNTFVMPEGNVTVTVTFVAIEYTITVEAAEGVTATTDPAGKATVGTTVTINATGEGTAIYKVVKTGTTEEVAVAGNTFTMPASNVTVTVSFVKPVEPEVVVDGDTASAEVKDEDIANAEVSDGTIVIEATTETADNVAKVEVTLPTQAILEKTAGDSSAPAVQTVEVSTDVGTVELPAEALQVAGGDTKEPVKMVVEKTADPKPAKGEDGAEVQVAVSFQVDLVKATSGEKAEVKGLNTEIKLSFNIAGLWNSTVKPVLAYIDDARNITRLKGDYINNIITGYVNHLSEFGVVEDVAEPDEPTTPEEPKPGKPDAISIGAETSGGVGTVRKITIDTTKVSVDGNYLLVRVTADGKNIIYMVSAQAAMDVSYKGTTDMVVAFLLDGSKTNVMPDPGDDLVLAGCMAWAGK